MRLPCRRRLRPGVVCRSPYSSKVLTGHDVVPIICNESERCIDGCADDRERGFVFEPCATRANPPPSCSSHSMVTAFLVVGLAIRDWIYVMALALYRRYRPDTFDGIVGQDQAEP